MRHIVGNCAFGVPFGSELFRGAGNGSRNLDGNLMKCARCVDGAAKVDMDVGRGEGMVDMCTEINELGGTQHMED